MHSLTDRLRVALAPEYLVERELGAGGMGRVFLARDVMLDHSVAIKIIRPELATAAAVERFLREARILAGIKHPNIVTVHRAGEASGLFYYVMDYLSGEPLSERLAKSRAPTADVVRLALDVLSALEAAHARGIIHRDLKPSNIFVGGGRTVVVDFGIAKSEELPSATSVPTALGTPAYMAPEQAAGGSASPRSDIYAAAAVIYEAFTGRRWIATPAPEQAEWSGVPRAFVSVLRRALAWNPEDRWVDARAFREALLRASHGKRPHRLGWAAAVLVAGASILVLTRRDTAQPSAFALAIVPLELAAGADTLLGQHVAHIAALNLAAVPGLTVVPPYQSFRWWLRHRSRRASAPAAVHQDLRAGHVLAGFVTVDGAEAVVRASLDGRGGQKTGDISFRGAADARTLGDSLTLHVLRVLQPAALGRAARFAGRSWDAVRPFLLCNDAFVRDDWATAERHCRTATERDSTFGLAWWQLAILRKWLPVHQEMDLLRRTAADTVSLTEQDRVLIQAYVAPSGLSRLQAYETVRRRYPDDALAAFLHGDELFHRGPLFGASLDSAAAVLLTSADLDRNLSPPLEHALWALIRLGREADATAVLARLDTAAGPADGDQGVYAGLIRQAFSLRFDPSAEPTLPGTLTDTILIFATRAGLSFGLPETAITLGERLYRARGKQARVRASGAIAQALALIATGRAHAGLAWLDSAAVLLGPESRLQAAQWRIIPGVLGWEIVSEADVAAARARLEGDWADAQHARALWTLTLDALARGDRGRAARLASRLRDAASVQYTAVSEALSLEPHSALSAHITASEAAARGEYAEALRLSQPLLDYRLLSEAGDPFFRSVLYLSRGSWYERLDSLEAAQREWLWSENNDITDWLDSPTEAAEIDWAFDAYSAYRRSKAAIRATPGDARRACSYLDRLEHSWRSAEQPTTQLLHAVRREVGECRQ